MKSFDTDLKKYAEKISLKASERRELRERVLAYMEYHPLPKQSSVTAEFAQEIPSESFVVVHFNSIFTPLRMRAAGGVFILFLIIAPFVAERSVPGDALYLVKTGFNETLQGQLANSPYEKIEFETKLMERRIGEARVLASEGKLTEEVKTQIAVTVKEHSDAVQDGLAELRTQDAEGAAIAEIAFNSSLEVQSAVLNSNNSTSGTSSIDSILTVVNDARDEVTLNQNESIPSFEGMMARVELETTRAYELFKAIKPEATPEEIVDIERRFSDIERLISEAKEKNTTEAEVAANELRDTLGLIQKFIVFMTDIDVREAVTLETLVPVVLSDAERTEVVKVEIQAIQSLATEITERLVTLEEDGVSSKVTEGLALVGTLLGKATTTLSAIDTTIDIATVEVNVREARALINDLDTMTKKADVAPVEDTATSTATGNENEIATSTEKDLSAEEGR
ncbi:MAG: DUF5667 domain-containing protein [Minisyncoccia bacterium]